MTDDVTRYSGGAAGGEAPSPGSGVPGDDEAALERLRALSGDLGAPAPTPTAKQPAGQPHGSHARPKHSAARRPASSRAGRSVARLAVPAVFLVAVLVVIVLLFQSGVLGGETADTPVSPSPKASATKSGSATPAASATKVYVVKSGDTLSGIADKFNTSIGELETLNPKVSTTTLVVGTKIKVPRN